MTDKYKKLIDETILHLSDCENMDEALEYFESQRRRKFLAKSEALFDELSLAQLAILFKLKIDNGDLILENNIIRKGLYKEDSVK